MLSQLPAPPPGKSGWPWTEESVTLSAAQPDNTPWPRISIVTPSFNQGKYIEETIRSVLLQNYPNLEYIIIDGGSSDNTPEIIEKYLEYLTYFVSEPDNGQSHAINKGFLRCTGEFVNWLCSDDVLCRDAFSNISPLISKDNQFFLIGSGFRIDENSKEIDRIPASGIDTLDKLVDIKKYWRNKKSILQQSVLFPSEALRKAGFLNENNYFTMDYELWGKLLSDCIPVLKTEIPVGMFRWYDGQKTSNRRQVTKSLLYSAQMLIINNTRSSVFVKLNQILRVTHYKIAFNYQMFRSFLGLKRRIKSIINA